MVDFGRGGRNLEETGYRGDSGVSRMNMLPAYPRKPGRIGPSKKLILLRRGLRNCSLFGASWGVVLGNTDCVIAAALPLAGVEGYI